MLTGLGRDPRESDFRLDRRAPRDDVPRHEVRIRRVRLHGDDLDFLRHGRPAVQDVGELRAQDAHLAVRPFRAVELQSLGPDERVLRLPRTVPTATNAFGSRPRNDRPGAVKNVNAETLMIPGMMRSPSPINIASRSSPAAI